MRTQIYHIFKLMLDDTRKSGKIIKKLIYPVDDYGLSYDNAMKIRDEMQEHSNDIYIVDTI